MSEYVMKLERYQKWLSLTNLLMIILGITMFVIGYDLVNTYYMNKLYHSRSELKIFWSFGVLPYLLIVTGFLTLLVSLVGFICTTLESKRILITYAITLGLLALLKFVLIYVAFNAEA